MVQSWSHSSFVLIYSWVSSKILSSRVSLPPLAFFLFVFAFSLYDESKHTALRDTEPFSCSFAVAHVPAPYVIVGVTTAPNRRSRCRSSYVWDVSSCSSCRCLVNADQAHRILCCTSVVSSSTNVIIFPKYSLSLQEEVSRHVSQFAFWLVRTVVLLEWISRHVLPYFFEILEQFLGIFHGARHHEHVVGEA